jgi:hypothetical protein
MSAWTRWLAACLAVVGGVALVLGRARQVPGGSTASAPRAATTLSAPTTEPPARRPKRTAEEWRKLYPFESLAGRLAYEEDKAHEPLPLGEEAAKRLERIENQLSGTDPRVESLKKLHSREVEDFISRDGFGLGRMMPGPSTHYLDLPTAQPISFPVISGSPAGPGKEAKAALPKTVSGTAGGSVLPSLEQLTTFHVGGQLNFLDHSSFGYVKDREHVAGFQPHQFRRMPELAEPIAAPHEIPKERWLVSRLELVSLLKHDKPVVYLSDHLPRMEDLKKADARPLTAFEDEALDRLRRGEDLVTEATARHIRMVGALRAGKQCLDCHHGRRGDLLGCFSYDLQRVARD